MENGEALLFEAAGGLAFREGPHLEGE
jgi:hypothetical protein